MAPESHVIDHFDIDGYATRRNPQRGGQLDPEVVDASLAMAEAGEPDT